METSDYAGFAPSIRESSEGKTKTGEITKQGSPLYRRWIILVQCGLVANKHDTHLRTLYDEMRNEGGHAIAIVASAKYLLVIIWYKLARNELCIDIWSSKDMNER